MHRTIAVSLPNQDSISPAGAGSNRNNKLTSGTNTDFLTQLSQNLGFDRQHNNVCGIHQFLIGSDPDAVFLFQMFGL